MLVAGNIDDDKEIDEIYTLLTENYVEDDDAWHFPSHLPTSDHVPLERNQPNGLEFSQIKGC